MIIAPAPVGVIDQSSNEHGSRGQAAQRKRPPVQRGEQTRWQDVGREGAAEAARRGPQEAPEERQRPEPLADQRVQRGRGAPQRAGEPGAVGQGRGLPEADPAELDRGRAAGQRRRKSPVQGQRVHPVLGLRRDGLDGWEEDDHQEGAHHAGGTLQHCQPADVSLTRCWVGHSSIKQLIRVNKTTAYV